MTGQDEALLVEREGELARAAHLLGRAGDGDGALLVLEGAAGAGKTRLLREITALAGERALTVLTGRGSELERDFAFGVLRQALEPALAGLDEQTRDALFEGPAATARAVVGAPSASTAQDPYAVLNGLFWLVSALANRNPLVLALDDVHWADESTLRFLGFLSLRLDSVPALVAIGTRPAAGDPLLAPLFAQPGTVTLRLRGLGQDSVRALVAARLGEPVDDAFVAACLAATGGNPFLLVDLLGTLRTDGVRPTRERAASVAAVNPANVARSVSARLLRLGPAATGLARSLATVGDAATLAFAAEVAGLDTEPARDAADALVLAGLLDPQLRFEHPLLRTAVLAGITPGERMRLNETAARLLEQAGAPPERIAAHLVETEPAGDERTANVLAQAGRSAVARGAPAVGARLLARALAEPPAASSRLALLHDLGLAETAAGVPGARERLREVVERSSDPVTRARVLIELLWSVGPRPDVVEELLPLFAAVEADDRELGLELEAARLGALFITPGRADEFAAACERRRSLAGDTPGECSVLAWVARHASVAPGGTIAEVAELAERAARHAGSSPLWALNMTLALLPAERFSTAERINTELIERAIGEGSASAFASASAWRALIRVAVGDLRGAEADARAAMDSRGMADIYPFQALIPLVEALTDQGRGDEAAALLADAGHDGALPPARPFTALLIARGRMHAAAGDPAGRGPRPRGGDAAARGGRVAGRDRARRPPRGRAGLRRRGRARARRRARRRGARRRADVAGPARDRRRAARLGALARRGGGARPAAGGERCAGAFARPALAGAGTRGSRRRAAPGQPPARGARAAEGRARARRGVCGGAGSPSLHGVSSAQPVRASPCARAPVSTT